ncbi:hydrogenase nickel incorporation protein HypB [Bradyrhizobium sp. CCGB12]|uniref:hydrogenase nickel incorporation protein HypB n=1 Tax=Bradyrhizobium sp. CCGB12 TaxID=2949632 RepID=UPI0020B37646|nr:hydrogenase nickel incorporation protein HypB [Bradyrhizobium sp. CCGB12]MCP3392446.1 hydrogenase nickel incorporation protein HypB [Bradyrhizobium sp. CCGB12]
MCTVCGCVDGIPPTKHADVQNAQTNGQRLDHGHDHHGYHHDHGCSGQDVRCARSTDDGHDHHDDGDRQAHREQALVDCGIDPAGLRVVGMSSERIIQVSRDILSKNNRIAAENRARFLADDLVVYNVLSSPGAGKTSLLVRAVSELKRRIPVGVIGGDQQTSNDAERIRATGVPAIQINTGKGCHLDAAMVGQAYRLLPELKGGVLFIENVGNLVCPAAFDLGEVCKIVVFSTTEGEDKPLKYPDIFATSSLMLINKIDLAPMVDFDLNRTIEFTARVSPNIEVLPVSARTGEGFGALYAWLQKQTAHRRHVVEDTRG